MIETCCHMRRSRAVFAVPCVQAEMVVITASRKERRIIPDPPHQVEAKHAAVEHQRTI